MQILLKYSFASTKCSFIYFRIIWRFFSKQSSSMTDRMRKQHIHILYIIDERSSRTFLCCAAPWSSVSVLDTPHPLLCCKSFTVQTPPLLPSSSHPMLVLLVADDFLAFFFLQYHWRVELLEPGSKSSFQRVYVYKRWCCITHSCFSNKWHQFTL